MSASTRQPTTNNQQPTTNNQQPATMPAPLNILFAGSGEFGLPTLKALLDAGHRIVRVFTQPDRPAGRGKQLTPTPIATTATALGLDTVRTPNFNVEILPPADVMVVIAFGQKIAPAAVNHPRLGSVNLHASILPKYRGAAPIHWAVINGDSVTGNSIIRLADKMDAGAVLAQSQLPIADRDTTADLHDRLAIDGASLMLVTLSAMEAGTAVETEQDHTAATIAPKLSRETAVLDFTQPASVVSRRINGLSPWPGCRVTLGNAELTLLRSEPGDPTTAAPGTLDAQGQIAAGDARGVRILELQPKDRKPMSLSAYQNGRPWPAEAVIHSR
jgi:methionyl-tRNA formyltransferase